MLRHSLAIVLLTASFAHADKLVLVAGGGEGPDGSPASGAKLAHPFAVDFAADGTTYFVEMAGGERLRSISPKGILTTLAGTFAKKGHSGDGGPGAQALFNGMHHLAVGPAGKVYLADSFNQCVRVYDPNTKQVDAFAGTGTKGFGGGPAAKATFGGVYCLSFSADGSALTLTDLDNRRIRKVDMATGLVSTIAGNGQKGIPKDGGEALKEPLLDPRAHTVDAKGNLYILERGGHCLRVVGTDGRIRTVAGDGKKGGAGLGGPALKAQMNGPKHLSIDRDGSVLIADTENHRIVRYVPGKEVLELVAGTGKKGTAGVGGNPKLAELSQPHGVIVHPKTGDIYISDSSNNRILKIVR